jgi:formylglycine-generating enzyme required for sulfatase activity
MHGTVLVDGLILTGGSAPAPVKPTVTTASITNITTSTATCGGNVTSDGGASVTARGVCWSTSANPTTSNSKTTNGSGTGSFTSSITGLNSNTTYHVRAYAINSVGTSYGSDVSFKTPAYQPTVTTASITNITTSTATCGGNVTSDGGASVTARGVCWSTSANPTTSNSKTTNGSGTGSFTSSITGLSPATTYHVRAYATNSAGTGYGADVPLRVDLGMTFVLIPAGAFTMGSPSDELGRDSDEGPQHQVTLSKSFYMQTTEVTQAQWEAVMGINPSHFKDCPTCPVDTVSWYDVQEFIVKMNQRGQGTYSLPTEAQWEYAARAGSTTAFYNGGITEAGAGYDPNLDKIGWYCYNSSDKTHPVAQKTPNAWGLYDMSGNIYEWCQDWYSGSYYSSSPSTDPPGPSSGSRRVLRGGDWDFFASYCRSADRNNGPPDARAYFTGFRLLRQP